MKLIGKNNGHMMAVKFLYSAVEELNNKSESTVTDFLALSAFVTAEKQDLEIYKSALEEDGRELAVESSAYLDLLQQMAADLSNPHHGIDKAIFDAHSSAGCVFYNWKLNKE
ncbi:hypothetical protein CC656_000452 [Salmonella enterica subsp. enterica]|nr:hypothetical protein [Salmonella enterica subsp. enterica]ECI7957023.1 hypothetical protein [Salmonella enterica subsp. enterica]ECJ5065648.1 hypothetical protein [Salmonella enterica subsp. enterica]EDT8008631.1 hypothetical protein [Salmonella enterica subsp. enterica]